MDMQTISAAEAKRKFADAVWVDIRSRAEYLREHIGGAVNAPLDLLQTHGLPQECNSASAVVFYCMSGMRTAQNRALLRQAAGGREAYILARGVQGWKNAGLDTVANRGQPLDLMRQVQIAAGALALGGAAGGWLVSPWLYLLCGLVGLGLLTAGLTGFCGMARLLLRMPWNAALRRSVKSG